MIHENYILSTMVMNNLHGLLPKEVTGVLRILYESVLLYFMNHVMGNMSYYIACSLKTINHFIKFRQSHVVELVGMKHFSTCKYENYDTFSESFVAVVHYVNTHCCHKIKAFKEVSYEKNRSYGKHTHDANIKSTFMISDKRTINIDDDIYLSFDTIENVDSNKDKNVQYNTIEYKIKLHTLGKDTCHILNFINKCVTIYNEHVKQKNKDIYFLNIKESSKEDRNDYLQFNTYIFKSVKTFDNVYLNNKDDILKHINFFMNNEEYYIKNGIPYTLGMLFHGEPGCGKSSFIKAVANHFHRHIVNVNLSNIHSIDELEQVFHMDKYNDIDLSYDKKIILLEDIDTMSNIVLKRHSRNDVTESTDSSTATSVNDKLLKCILNQNKKEQPTTTTNHNINLSHLLNLIDGVVEMHGRIIIMTTNHVDKLDDALIRPGRIDLKVNFQRITGETIKHVITKYIPFVNFEIPLWDSLNFNSITISPAELINILIKNKEKEDCLVTELYEKISS